MSDSEAESGTTSPHPEDVIAGSKFDPSKFLERSQSDAELLDSDSANYKRSLSYTSSSRSTERLESFKREQKSKVSESSKVYFDLSNIDTMEMESMLKSKYKGKSLETIPQDKEVTFNCKSSSTIYSMSNENLTEIESHSGEFESQSEDDESSFYTKYPLILPRNQSSDSQLAWQHQSNLKLGYQKYSQQLEEHIKSLKTSSSAEEIVHLNKILSVLNEAWGKPIYGRDLAYSLCDVIRQEGVLDLTIKNCGSSNKELLKASAALLEQSLSTENRERVAKNGLEIVVSMTYKSIGDNEMASVTTGILEGLFKVSEEASTKIVSLGGLDVILYWCRSSEVQVLRHCAKAIANLSLFGGADNQEEMARRNVPEWLFPLAFMEDNNVRYYACLAISVLVANKEIEAAVCKSGTLDLVMPFISSTKPSSFARSDFSHKQGRDKVWLHRLVPLLSSRREEAQALAAFHFAMEAGIKEEQGRQGVFYDIHAVEPLKKVASSPNATASKLAAQALKIIGEDIPHKLTPQVPVWGIDDVAHWVAQVGFKDFVCKFQDCQVDGDLLLLMTEEDLKESLEMKCAIARKRFLRELNSLKITADYSSCDPSKLDAWLMKLLPELSQYTYNMLRKGMNRELLSTTSSEELEKDCGVINGIHRRIILERIEELYTQLPKCGSIGSLTRQKSIDVTGLVTYPKSVDVFISYRRSTGSQLASLLKVHLQLRGFSVFLDIDRLRAGKFDENLLMNIKLARHFLLVLTPNALDRCIGDEDRQDWIHKEVVTALESDCNIIPVLDNFDWPASEVLPEDMQQVVYFNGVRWVHDYQEACMAKLEAFLRGRIPPIPPLDNTEITSISQEIPPQPPQLTNPEDCDALSPEKTSNKPRIMGERTSFMRKASTGLLTSLITIVENY